MARPPTAPARTGAGLRRTRLRRHGAPVLRRARGVLLDANLGHGVLAGACFAMVCTLLVVWAREQPLIAVGRVMNETRTVRVGFSAPDPEATARAREEARDRTPRIYVANSAFLDAVRRDLETLPRTLAGVESLELVSPAIREQFRLTQETFEAVRQEAVAGEPGPRWRERVAAFMELLKARPLLDQATWQRATLGGLHERIILRVDGREIEVPRGGEVNIASTEQLEEAMRTLARRAEFTTPALRSVIADRLVVNPQPTYALDDVATAAAMNEAQAAVAPVIRTIPVGSMIYVAGEPLTPAQLERFRAELRHFAREAPGRLWVRRAGVLLAVSAVTLAIGGYVGLFCPRIARNPARMWGLGGLMALGLVLSCGITAAEPRLAALSAVAPTILVAVLVLVAYDRRVALAMGLLHGLLACVALRTGLGNFALIVVGVGVTAWQLAEIRHRNSVVRASIVTAVALALGTVAVSVLERPIVPRMLVDMGWDAALAGMGGLIVGAITLFILPAVERVFDITTGMTLIELRDPRHPLLRQLQQRAPGTYNHSLNVASIAEAAADAIGADPLLAYVGALYHDVGKMNKPDYFVENQAGGPNRHDKLSPAMSVLVIVGHVKDGLEIAREFNLPRSVHHFIEAHHGTTLVEFFFDRAKRRAVEAGDGGEPAGHEPQEIEYRYPGPRPRTREVAIVMLADAVESTTRTIAEPTPGRIDQLVRTISRKRLLDGQFDDCDLTLRELSAIEGSISKSVASTYHGRVAYPAEAPEPAEGREQSA